MGVNAFVARLAIALISPPSLVKRGESREKGKAQGANEIRGRSGGAAENSKCEHLCTIQAWKRAPQSSAKKLQFQLLIVLLSYH